MERQIGAPTKYKKEYAEGDYLQGYFDECCDEDKPKLISLCGYACYIGVTEKTLDNWALKHQNFLRALDIIRQRSKEMLMHGGLFSTYNPTICKLCLSANHGMKEKTDITTNDESITIALPEKFKDI